jgi:acetyltransferase-like isoleucine patch superfamily enzyme/dTDP-4-dehydrorhamnose 3,5-epimerase-like enzyme
MNIIVHKLADVASDTIGDGTRIWQYVVVLPGARIGANCSICSQVFIENDVVIGDRVTIKCGVQLWDGMRVGNDLFPRSKKFPDKYLETTLEDGASIGAGAVILPGLTIGQEALVGAGATVIRSVPPRAIVVGNPARIIGYTDTEKQSASTLAHTTQAGQPGSSGVLQSIVSGVTLHKFPFISDMRGNLSVGEFEQTMPFIPKRYFLVFDVPSAETRGEHAHYRCKQFLICVRGRCSVVADDGRNREEFMLNKPDIGLYLPPMTWGIQYMYSADAMLLVFASEHYDKSDYIRDYAEFLGLVGERR